MLNDSTSRRPPRMGGARPNTVKYNKPKVVRRPQSSYNRPDMASNSSSRTLTLITNEIKFKLLVTRLTFYLTA